MSAVLLQVTLQPGQGVQVQRPRSLPAGIEPRLAALEGFAARAGTWLRQWGYGQARFAVQLHDEDPEQLCFRFDAPLADDGLGPLIPDPYALASHGFAAVGQQLAQLPPWDARLPLAIWRGSSTGLARLSQANLAQLPRYRLCALSRQLPQLLDARLTAVVQAEDPEGLRRHLLHQDLLGPRLEPLHLALHRWLIEIDGNVNSWGLLWKLLSGCCILRVHSPRRQWYHQQLVPWRHLVPIEADLSDLTDKLQWCQRNLPSCAAIAAAGRQLALSVVQNLEQDQQQAVRRFAERWL